ncbi:MAG: phosphoribosyltransferase family protein [Thiotrichaceae bacterium]|nr:phosphoribosyltransferase family protein [Thiotrichaceae bacterium]
MNNTQSEEIPVIGKTIAIILGANDWPHWTDLDSIPNNNAFKNAANEFKEYITGVLRIPYSDILDLFDSDLTLLSIDKEIERFLKVRSSDKAYTDVILYYVGHGTIDQNQFAVLLKSSEKSRKSLTIYKMRNLKARLDDAIGLKRFWIFLDCCFAGSAVVDFQPQDDIQTSMLNEAESVFLGEGIAFFAACAPDKKAFADFNGGITQFSHMLLGALGDGSEDYGDKLTANHVFKIMKAKGREYYGEKAIMPELHSPKNHDGGMLDTPFFPNPAKAISPKRTDIEMTPDEYAEIMYSQVRFLKIDNIGKKEIQSSITWQQIIAAIDKLVVTVQNFAPDAMLCLDSKGGLIAELISEKMGKRVPIFVGHRYRIKSTLVGKEFLLDYIERQTDRYRLFIPDITHIQGKKILIIDDYTITGDTLALLKRFLIEQGFHDETIKTLALVISTITVVENGSKTELPDYWELLGRENDIHLPYMSVR